VLAQQVFRPWVQSPMLQSKTKPKRNPQYDQINTLTKQITATKSSVVSRQLSSCTHAFNWVNESLPAWEASVCLSRQITLSFFFFFFFFFETGYCFVAQVRLSVSILLPQPPKWWNYGRVPVARPSFLKFLALIHESYSIYCQCIF
jgi:hypothetical protein